MFFVPSFAKAFSSLEKNKDESIKSIINEPAPGIYTFDMLQPRFCEMLLSEVYIPILSSDTLKFLCFSNEILIAQVENFEKWVHETKFRIMRPNTMNKFGAVLDDFGMQGTLDKLMEDFIRHISKSKFFYKSF